MVGKADYIKFTKEMKREYTILVPTMLPIHFKLISNVLVSYGYKVDFLEDVDGDIKESGLRYVHNDTCYPALLVIGQLINAVESGRYDKDKVALLITQTGGGCRASNYIYLLRKALKKAGYGHIPVISLNFNMIEKHPGFSLTVPMLYRMLYCAFYGDLMMLMANQCRPYEKRKGETDRLVKKWTEKLLEESSHASTMRYSHVKKNYRMIADDFNRILGDTPRNKVKVGIVGEIYVKYASFGNNGLEEFLLSQGCEYMVPGVLGFFQYCFENRAVDREYYGKSRISVAAGKAALAVANRWEEMMLDVLKPYPEFVAPVSFEKVKELSNQVIDIGVKMGEGWLLPGETAELIEKGYTSVICAQPFGCLPNHIVGKGTIRKLRELYPEANIFPVDYDPGASKVNQENRIKLMLAIAREREQEPGA